MTEADSLAVSISNHIHEAMTSSNGDRAIYHLVEARELLQRLYYNVWHKHHTSGTLS